MPGIMADNDTVGQFAILINVLRDLTWDDVLKDLGFVEIRFGEVGLKPESKDAEVWHTCQDRQIMLITANRNQEAAHSLEATIRAHNRPDSMPVITIADAERLVRHRSYAERAVRQLEEYLVNLDRYRGAGRLYIP